MRGRRRRAGGNTRPLTGVAPVQTEARGAARRSPTDTKGSDARPRGQIACVHLPAFALQLFARREPAVREGPAVVVDRDHPRGKVVQANEAARRARVLPGQRYAAALSLCPGLRATEVPAEEIAAGVAEVVGLLRRASPDVEAAKDDARLGEPGVFWLDATGLLRLHPTLLAWGERLARMLAAEGFIASIVVGVSRFGSYALSRALAASAASAEPGRRVALFPTPDDEREAARRVPLARLAIDPNLRDALDRLGVRRVGDFLDLPREGLARRFGKEAERLFLIANGELTEPLTPVAPREPPVCRVPFEFPETGRERLLAVIERDLPGLLAETAERRQALASLFLRFHLEDRAPVRIEAQPAAPTLDVRQVLELVKLRLESVARNGDLRAGVVELVLTVRGVAARPEQLRLFRENPKRDLAAAARALARVRAEMGPHAVVRARLRDGHLPEASFSWEPLEEMHYPRLAVRADTRPAALVRRVLTRPLPLAPRSRHDPDGWLLAGLQCGPVRRQTGPYVLSGGWWAAAPGTSVVGTRTEVHRAYHFTETARGDLLWVFHDRHRRRWFLQGAVE